MDDIGAPALPNDSQGTSTLSRSKPAGRRRPSILILILDALRARNVSCYGYQVRTTPHLDAFAGDSILFKRAYTTTTWTVPSHASMLSGLYLSQHRLENIQGNRRFHPAIVPLPTALRSAGYKTAAFSQNVLFSPAHSFDYFDEFYAFDELQGSRQRIGQPPKGAKGSSPLSGQISRYLKKMTRSRAFFETICDWIRHQDEDKPLFLMANVVDTHYPWTPSPIALLKQLRFDPRRLLDSEYTVLEPWQFNSGRKQATALHSHIWRCMYDAAAMHVDRELGRFLNQLRRTQIWEDLIIVITSDHGEQLGEHRGLVGHMLSLHDDILHIPLIIRHPDYSSGLLVESVLQTLDLYPSVLEWADVTNPAIPRAQLQRPTYSQAIGSPGIPTGYAFAEEDYTDSYNVLDGLVANNPDLRYDHYPRQQIATHSATHKYIWYDDRAADFYDLVHDPLEERSLTQLGEQPSVLMDLRQAMENWRSNLEVFSPQVVEDTDEVSPETISRLRALGYVP